MLNLEVLFNKRPFIYLVNDVYYAFGTGVCARCDKRAKYLTLHSKYQKYLWYKRRSYFNKQQNKIKY